MAIGLAKLRYQPGMEFLELFMRTCEATQLQGFKPQDLASTIYGERCRVLNAGPGARLYLVVGQLLTVGPLTGRPSEAQSQAERRVHVSVPEDMHDAGTQKLRVS
jgi:hypothetical protein